MPEARPDGQEEGREPEAEAGFRRLGIIFWLGVTLVEHAEWLVSVGRDEEAQPLLEEARETWQAAAKAKGVEIGLQGDDVAVSGDRFRKAANRLQLRICPLCVPAQSLRASMSSIIR